MTRKLVYVVVVTAVVLAIGALLYRDSPTATGGIWMTVRGHPTGWYRLEIPAGWFYYDHVDYREVNSADIDSSDEDDKRVKLEIFDRGDFGLLDSFDPAENTTSTISVDGFNGFKVVSSPATNGDLIAASTVYKIAINPTLQGEDFYIASHIFNYDDEQELLEFRQQVDAIVSGIDFLPNYADDVEKTVTTVAASQLPNVAGYDINHPLLWTTSEGQTQSSIIVTGQGSGGQVSVNIVPGGNHELWNQAEHIPRSEAVLRYGPNGIRRANGRLLTEYVLGIGAQPSLISVDAPDLAENSAGYWTNEMLVWYVLYGTDIRYEGVGGPSYPAP